MVIVALEGQPAFEIWLRWFSADALGLMIVTPCLLVMRRYGVRRAFQPLQSQAGIMLLAALVVTLTIVFSQSAYPLLFLVIACLVIAATTLPTASVVVMLTIACLVSIACTVTGHGPMSLVAGDRGVRLLVLQLYMATTTLISLMVSSATAARLSTMRSLSIALKRKERDALRMALASRVAGVGYWRMKRGMQRFDCSPEALEIFGMSAEARPHLQDFLDCYTPADRERVHAASLVSLDEATPLDLQVSLSRVSDGETRVIHIQAAPQVDADGAVVALEGVVHDITNAANLMHKVSQSEARYRELAEALPDLVLRAKHRKIVYASNASRRLLGYSPSELEGRDLAEFVHPEDVAASLERYAGYERGHLPTETVRHRSSPSPLTVTARTLKPRLKASLTVWFGSLSLSLSSCGNWGELLRHAPHSSYGLGGANHPLQSAKASHQWPKSSISSSRMARALSMMTPISSRKTTTTSWGHTA